MKSATTLEVLENTRFVGRPENTGLSNRQRVALSQLLKVLCARDFKNNRTAMAREWGLNQSQLNNLVNGSKRSAGVKVLTIIREKTQYSLDTLLGLDLTGDHVVLDAQVRLAKTPDEQAELAVAKAADDAERAAEERAKAKKAAAKPKKAPRPPKSTPRLRVGSRPDA